MHIVLTGGGTAGHVVPNLAIADAMLELGDAKITYFGSKRGMERKLVLREMLDYQYVATGKLRRYFDLRNCVDAFKVPYGILEAWWKLGKVKPDLVFSKGGFVALPVVIGAWMRRIPVVIHESDAIPSLTTKITARFAREILLGYECTKKFLKPYKNKCRFVGNPVRAMVMKGSKAKAKKLTGFSGKRPVLLIMGGSSGSAQINHVVKEEKERLIEIFDVIHITGTGKGRKRKHKHYYSLPYAHEELRDFYALASLALTRAGASTLAELEALQMPTLLYPLGTHASRGDQIINAKEMTERHKYFMIADETKSAHSQLLLLPRQSLKKVDTHSAEVIANLLLNFK